MRLSNDWPRLPVSAFPPSRTSIALYPNPLCIPAYTVVYITPCHAYGALIGAPFLGLVLQIWDYRTIGRGYRLQRYAPPQELLLYSTPTPYIYGCAVVYITPCHAYGALIGGALLGLVLQIWDYRKTCWSDRLQCIPTRCAPNSAAQARIGHHVRRRARLRQRARSYVYTGKRRSAVARGADAAPLGNLQQCETRYSFTFRLYIYTHTQPHIYTHTALGLEVKFNFNPEPCARRSGQQVVYIYMYIYTCTHTVPKLHINWKA